MYSPVSHRVVDKPEWLINLRGEERDFVRSDLRLEGMRPWDRTGPDKMRQPWMNLEALTPVSGRADNKGDSEEADQLLQLLKLHVITFLLLGKFQAKCQNNYRASHPFPLSQWPHHTLAEG